MIDRLASRRLWLPAALLLTVGVAGAQNTSVPFRTITVLPAKNASGDGKLGVWTIGWQYLIQERIRELPGLKVARFQDAPELVEQLQAGKLDVSTIAVRNQVTAALKCDALIAPTIVGRTDEQWELKAELIEPAVGPKPTTEVTASGTLPLVLVDQIVVDMLKAALRVPKVELEPYGSEEIDAQEMQGLVASLWMWPYVRPEDAQRGQLDRAQQLLSRAVTRARFFVTYQRFAMVQIAAGKAAEALPPIEKVARQSGNSKQARHKLLVGETLAAAGRDNDAIEHLIEAAKLSKGSLPAVNALARAYRRQGKVDLALAQYEAAAGLWPNVRPFRMFRGDLALEAKKPETAAKAYQAAVLLAPAEPDGYVGLVKALLEQGKPGDAYPWAQKLLELAPDNTEALVLHARSAFASNHFEEARASAAKVVELDANQAAAQSLLGRSALALDDYATAKQALAAAVKLDPKDIVSYRALSDAHLYAPEPDYPAADAALTSALKVAPDVERPALWFDLARLRFFAQKHDEALKAVAQVEQLLPNDASPIYLEAQINLYAGKPDKAIEALGRAVAIDAKAAGEGQTVIAALEQAERDTPGFDNVKPVLGYLYQAAGRTRDARKKYNEYLASPSAAQMGEWVRGQLASLDSSG